jgi:hypothetical protein
MKSIIISITLILCFSAGTKAGSDQPIMISNIRDGQELTGEVKVELAADDLQGYRWVTWCMDGNLVRNVYTAPFTLVFDSRDFKNGSHELSVRALSVAGPIHEHKMNVSISNASRPLNFIFENPKLVVQESRIMMRSSYVDAPHPVLKKSDTELYFFHNLGLMMHQRENQGITYCASGTIDEPYRTLEWTRYVPELWDKNGHATQGIWLMGIYRIGENELLGFTHNESCYDPDRPCNRDTKSFSVGIGYSRDNGKSWTYCGDVVRHHLYEEFTGNNMGGVPYILVDGYFQIYFHEYAEREVPYPGAARAKIDEVIAAARKGKKMEWKKYRNGEWNENGLTGLSDRIMAGLGDDFNMHCKATYIPSIHTYVMLTYKRGAADLYLLTSDDGLGWEIADVLKDPNSDERISYPFFADFYSDDCHEVDEDFHIFWTKAHKELWGSRVRLMN